jgi:hypothetical protein
MLRFDERLGHCVWQQWWLGLQRWVAARMAGGFTALVAAMVAGCGAVGGSQHIWLTVELVCQSLRSVQSLEDVCLWTPCLRYCVGTPVTSWLADCVWLAACSTVCGSTGWIVLYSVLLCSGTVVSLRGCV